MAESTGNITLFGRECTPIGYTPRPHFCEFFGIFRIWIVPIGFANWRVQVGLDSSTSPSHKAAFSTLEQARRYSESVVRGMLEEWNRAIGYRANSDEPPGERAEIAPKNGLRDPEIC